MGKSKARQVKRASDIIDIVLKHTCINGISEGALVNAEIDFEDYTACNREVMEYLIKSEES